MGVELDLITQAHVDRATDDLCHEFEGVFSRETVARFISESIVALGGARFADFVPLLAHRFARERLRALGQSEGTIEKPSPRFSSSASRTPGAASSLQRF